jgi:Spy/CpxP family protein refolding chaperone
MKRSILSAVAVLGLTAAIAVAAPNGNKGGHGGKHGKHGAERSARLAERLNLTDAQKQQWQSIEQTFRNNNKTFLEQSRQTMADFRAAKQAGDTAKANSLKPLVETQRAQMNQLRAAQEQQLAAILTPAQRTQYDALKAERASRHGEHGRGRGDRRQQ